MARGEEAVELADDASVSCQPLGRRGSRRGSALQGGGHGGSQAAVEFARDIALEAPAGFRRALAFGGAAGDVGTGARAVAHADGGDGVDRLVQRSVSSAG